MQETEVTRRRRTRQGREGLRQLGKATGRGEGVGGRARLECPRPEKGGRLGSKRQGQMPLVLKRGGHHKKKEKKKKKGWLGSVFQSLLDLSPLAAVSKLERQILR